VARWSKVVKVVAQGHIEARVLATWYLKVRRGYGGGRE